jgi:hypothetical protein
MDNYDEEFYTEVLQETTQEYLELVQERVKEIFQESLDDGLYDIYNPSVYHRNYSLRDSVTTHIDTENNILYVYPNINEGIYYSAVTGEDVSQYVADWILVTGHHDGSSVDNMYHNYDARNVLQIAKQKIEKEFGFDVEIIDNENNIYESF